MNQDYESSNKRIKIVTNMNEANQVEFQSAIIRTPLTAIQSPLIRTPHDPQALDEFKGIFAPAAIYSPSKLYIDYQRSPVQRNMWWMDETEESNGESWLKDNTLDDKNKFFEALERNEIIPDFSDDDDEELLDSINDLNSEIDKLQTQYEANIQTAMEGNDKQQEPGTQQSFTKHPGTLVENVGREELSFDGDSFIEESISSVKDVVEDCDSGQVTPKYNERESKKEVLESVINGDKDIVISVTETVQLKELNQGNVLGDFESDEEDQSFRGAQESALETDSDNQDATQDEDLRGKKGHDSISFASFEESTILLENVPADREMHLKEQVKESFPKNNGSLVMEKLDIQTVEGPSEVAVGEVAVGEVAVGEVAVGEVASSEVAAGEVASSEVASSEVGVGEVGVGEVDASEVAVGEVASSEVESIQEKDELSQKSTASKKGIKVDKEELLKFQAMINDLESQVKELEQDLSTKEKENDTLKKESALLESILAKEQANSKRLLSRMGGNNQADLTQLRKEVEDQERLIHGYQLENERLIDLNKDLKMQLKESEKKEVLKSEKLSREITALKTQLSERERFQTRSELGVATYQLQIETLEQELQAVKSSSLETSEYQKAEIDKLKAMLKEANKSKVNPDASANSNLTSSKEFLEMKDKYDTQILELEKKLKWHMENQEIIDDLKKSNALKDTRIKNLEDSLDSNSSSKKDLRRRSLVDIQKINTLEAEIKKLKDTGTKSRSNVALKAEKPVKEKDDDVMSLLEAKISTLNQENEQLSRDAEVRIRSLQQEYNGLRIQYEKNMEEMEKKLQDFENNDDEALKSRISELEIELEAKENQLKQASESNVRKRVLELELLLDEQSNIYMALLKEKSDLKEQLIKITREREKLIDSYEAQVEGMEKALRDKIFAVEETKHLDEINDLKLKREADQREILDLKTKLEISEKTRSSVQETTLVILKQAQEESAKIAMAHHERSLKSFLSEIRAETGQKSRQDEELEAQLSEALSMIEKLQKTNFDLECSNASLSDQVKTLTADLASLQEAKSNLETIIKDSKTSWPPSQQTFEGLKERIRELESASNKRESDIVQLLEESRISVSQELAQEKRDLLNILNRKDAEIISFKEELESLMGMIIKLKNEKF